ncbi:MAG: hypothetical protein HDS20_04735 [Bacteroides sp.]|nr:hypothetical protein [Bacteroides sp.]
MKDYQFLAYTQQDAINDGLDFVASNYSMKAVRGESVIGCIIFEDSQLSIPGDFITGITSEMAKKWCLAIKNKSNTICLKKIIWKEAYLSYGILEDLFDYILYKVLQRKFLIWCIPSECGKSYTEQLGFTEPPHCLPDERIRLYSVDD